MPSSSCDSEALQDALDRYRRSNARRLNRQAELEQFIKELQQGDDTKALEVVKRLAEITELLAQMGDSLKERSRWGALEAAAKAVGMITGALIDDIRAANQQANNAERLRILREDLRLDLEEEKDARSKAGVLLDAYWQCTERLAPQQLRFQLDLQVQGGFLGVVTRSELCSTGEAALVAAAPCVETEQRLLRWLEDPTLAEQYTAKGELTLTIPLYSWSSSGGVTVHNVTHQEDGGPLSFDASVRWLRRTPDLLAVQWILPIGQRMQHVRGEVRVFGQGQSFFSDHDLIPALRQAFVQQAEPPQPLPYLSAGGEASRAWRQSQEQTSAWGRHLLDATVTR